MSISVSVPAKWTTRAQLSQSLTLRRNDNVILGVLSATMAQVLAGTHTRGEIILIFFVPFLGVREEADWSWDQEGDSELTLKSSWWGPNRWQGISGKEERRGGAVERHCRKSKDRSSWRYTGNPEGCDPLEGRPDQRGLARTGLCLHCPSIL